MGKSSVKLPKKTEQKKEISLKRTTGKILKRIFFHDSETRFPQS